MADAYRGVFGAIPYAFRATESVTMRAYAALGDHQGDVRRRLGVVEAMARREVRVVETHVRWIRPRI